MDRKLSGNFPRPLMVLSADSDYCDRSGVLQTEVQEVVVVTEVDGDEDGCFEVSGEVRAVSPFDSGTEIAAVEEVANDEQTRRLEQMLKHVQAEQADQSDSQNDQKDFLRLPRSRKGRRKRRWSTKVSRTWKRYASEGVQDDGDVSVDDDYMDMEGMQRMGRRKPRKRLFAHRLQWSNINMESAMTDVRENQMTLRGAAKKHNVPYSTLKDRIQGRVVHGTKPGVKTVLSPEEESDLVQCIQQLEAGGFHLHCNNIRELARQMLLMRVSRGCNMPYRDGCPGHNWLAGFLKRHPGIQIKRSLNRNVVLSASKQKQTLKRFYDTLTRTYKKTQLYHRPGSIFAVGDIKLNSCPRASVIVAVNASGIPLPPFVILRGTTGEDDKSALSVLPEYKDALFYSSRGRYEEDMLLPWLRDHFLRCRAAQHGHSVILLLSRPVSEISLGLIQLAEEENITLISIPSGVSHLIHPINANLTRAINSALTSSIEQFVSQGALAAGQMPPKSILAASLYEVWSADWPLVDVERAFTDSGIYPLNARAITMDRIHESMPEHVEDCDIKEEITSDDDDDDDDDDDASDIVAPGLNLLSELSTMEELHEERNNTQYNSGRQRLAKRLRTDEMTDSTYTSSHCHELKMSEELMRRILGPQNEHDVKASVGTGRSTSASELVINRPDVRAEIAASRVNYDQLSRAVSSIIDNGPQQTAAKLPISHAKPISMQAGIHGSEAKRPIVSQMGNYKWGQRRAPHNVTVEEDTPHTRFVSPFAGVSSTIKEETSRDIIEEVDLSDLYVHVDEMNAGKASSVTEIDTKNVMNNNSKVIGSQTKPTVINCDLSQRSVATASSSSVVHCDLQQLASQVHPDQKVDIIQNIVAGGRVIQIIRRVPFEQVLRSYIGADSGDVAVEVTGDTEADCEVGDNYSGQFDETV